MVDKLNWEQIFENMNYYSEIPDTTPIGYTGEKEEFNGNITEKEINKMKDNNGTIQFMNVMLYVEWDGLYFPILFYLRAATSWSIINNITKKYAFKKNSFF